MSWLECVRTPLSLFVVNVGEGGGAMLMMIGQRKHCMGQEAELEQRRHEKNETRLA